MNTTLSSRSIVVAARDQVSCDLDGEAAILSTTSGIYYGLNPLGAQVWVLLRTPQRIEEIREVVLSQYDVEPERCERDLMILLEQLLAVGLIEVRHEPAA